MGLQLFLREVEQKKPKSQHASIARVTFGCQQFRGGGGPVGPLLTFFYRLEGEFRGELNLTGIAAPHPVKLPEIRMTRLQERRRRGPARRVDAIDASSRVLRMVKRVVEVASDLELLVLADGNDLREAEIEVVNNGRA